MKLSIVIVSWNTVGLLEKMPPLAEPAIQFTQWIISYNILNHREVLARAYAMGGEVEKAIAEYKRLVTFDPRARYKHLINPQNYYRLAKLYEQKGDKAKATEQYEKFLDLWKDADPGIVGVEDARKRLAVLRR